MDGGDGCDNNVNIMPLNCTLKNGKFYVVYIISQKINNFNNKNSPFFTLTGVLLNVEINYKELYCMSHNKE